MRINQSNWRITSLDMCQFLNLITWTNKTGINNDPLGRSTVPAGSGFPFILKIWES